MKRYRGWLLPAALLTVMFLIIFVGCTTSSYTPGYEVKVMGNNKFLSGSHGAMRIITYDPSNSKPVANVPVRIFLKAPQQESDDVLQKQGDAGLTPEKTGDEGKASGENIKDAQGKEMIEDYGDKVFSGMTDRTGSLDASFEISPQTEGNVKLTILTGLKGKPQKIETDITVEKKFKIYLTTDKPLYQPSQEINIRALALNIPSLAPVADKVITLEVEDAKGNKVFKKMDKTSRFGVSSAKFQLADEVNMGEYHIRALIENESSEKSVTVKKYVLPKFKIDFKKDRKFYAPGDTIKGDVQADYFFGKPVSGGKVTAKLFTFDYEFVQAAEVKGITDKEGRFSFELKIPNHLVGQPLEKGGAAAKLDIEVMDTADHKEKAVRMIPVSKESLKVQTIPESGKLKLDLENLVYILTSFPDGSPAKTTLTLNFLDDTRVITTDEAGIASFTVKPTENKPVTLNISASTTGGEKVTLASTLIIAGGEENVILRTDRAEYRVGDTMNFEILSTKGKGSFYMDLVKDNQTVLTKAYDVDSTRCKNTMDITPDLAGMVSIHLYRITDKNQIIRDTRNIFVRSADNLKISAGMDKPEYNPGEDARIDFTVVNRAGSPVAAALGVDIVDEAVFALGEMLPGLERVYFLLEQQLMEPKYEIHGMTLVQAVMNPDQALQDQQTLKTILFSEIPSEQQFQINIDTYREKLRECHEKMTRISRGLMEFYRKYQKYPTQGDLVVLIKEKFITEEDAVDPWGHKFYLVTPEGENKYPGIKSAGPNGKVSDVDDILFEQLQNEYGMIMRGRVEDGRFEGGQMLFNVKRVAEAPMAKADMSMEKEAATPVPAMGGEGAGKKPVRVREYFPETLYANPQVITDENGKAQIGVKMADSITTWRMSVFGNSAKGEMGNMTSGIKVFQDFFIDIDFPVALTQGDEVSVPIAVYNYLKEPQEVKITVEKGDWFKMVQGSYEQTLKLEKDEVKAVHFPIKVLKLGKHKLTVNGTGSKMSDAVRREIEVLPDGEMVMQSVSDRVEQQVDKTVIIPKYAIKGASKILVRLYPGMLSQVVEGLDKILRMPSGCFEQTSASTYPNALVLDYLKKQKKLTPEIQMKAEGYINTGYQKLVSFEVQGGGFSWFGTAPANKALTAFGIMEFRDMSKVHDVDQNLINRTQQWLARQQNQDGSWTPDEQYCHAESWAKMQGGGKIPVTSYIAWALAESGYNGPDLQKGIAYLKKNAGQLTDPYILSLTCNALASAEPDSKETAALMKKLAKMAKVSSKEASWATKLQTNTYSHGGAANLETTALATLACLKVKGYENLAGKGIAYLVKNKDPYGTWGSTQGTILAMKALLLAQEKAVQKINAKVKITVNGKRSEEFDINSDNYDVYRQADFGDITLNGKNKVEITIQGEGSCFYQIASRHYVPWKTIPTQKKPLSINVAYDRTTLRENDMLTGVVSVKNNTKSFMNMVMVDLGVPPGFVVLTPDLDQYVGQKFIKYSLTPRQVIIYIEAIKPTETIKFNYRLRAKFPLRAKTPRSKTYQYYNPDVNDVTKPVTLEVK